MKRERRKKSRILRRRITLLHLYTLRVPPLAKLSQNLFINYSKPEAKKVLKKEEHIRCNVSNTQSLLLCNVFLERFIIREDAEKLAE